MKEQLNDKYVYLVSYSFAIDFLFIYNVCI